MPRRTVTDDEILDAALECVLGFGVRRTTLTDVARAAGVSRVTVYRRFPDLESVLGALMTREFGSMLLSAKAHIDAQPHARARVVAALTSASELLAGHPLFQRIIDLDPELLLPYLTRRVGRFQNLVLSGLEHELKAKDGSLADDLDVHTTARVMELAMRGHVISSASQEPEVQQANMRELSRMLDAYLTP